MNKHLTDAELQLRMMAHTKQAVNQIAALFAAPPRPARQLGEADDTYAIRTEDRAMEVYFKAEAEFLSKVQDALALTDLCKDEMQSVMDAVHDHRISRDAWEEKVRA
jgi:hypothetical protein